MDLVSLSWYGNGGRDIHLMRETSNPVKLVNLKDRLKVVFTLTSPTDTHDQDMAAFLAANPNTECTFKPTFKATLDASTHVYEGFGVKVNARTGEVSAGPNLAADPLYNFTVLATLVANKNDADLPRKQAFLRFHLHKYVVKAWLHPSHLHVPKNISGFEFSLYAQFDDNSIAEIKQNSTWESAPPGKVDDFGSLSFGNTDPDGSEVEVGALLHDDYKSASGAVVFAKGIAIPYTLPQQAQLIPGSAGYERRDEVPNFIFLADGFQIGDETKFNSMIDRFLTSLRQDAMFKPFDHLLSRMNFWKVFVPSAARGIGTKYELFGEAQAQPVPKFAEDFVLENDSPTSEDDLNNDEWGPNQVRFYFGLPLLEHKGMSNGNIKAYWKKISRLPAGLIDEMDDDDALIDEWKLMGDRRIVDDSDTFIGMYNGAPTSAKVIPDEDPRMFELNFSRFLRFRLNDFLVALQYKDESGVLHPIGPVWDSTRPPAGGPPAGKDYDNVVILLCANYGRAQNETGNLCSNVIADQRDYLAIEADVAANDGFADGRAARMTDLGADRLLDDMPLMPGKTTLLHEIAHSLGLSDEYGEGEITKQSSWFQFSGIGNIESDKHYSNVQLKSDLVVSSGSEELDAEKVKWRWHRLAKSGVLAPLSAPAPAAITRNGSQYTIKLKPGQAAAFAKDDVVFLRRRKLGESILTDIEYSEVSPLLPEPRRYPFVTRSPELVVLHVDPAPSEVRVKALDPASLSGHDLVADFPAECILYKPLPARAVITEFPPAGVSLELTAANILRFMDGTGRPLHEKVDNDGHPDLDFEPDQNPVPVDFSIPMCAKKNRNIVGLYAGGNRYHHGVYHPAGHCIMRDNHQIGEFCSVCKYILTDYIDPALHPDVDPLFEEYYPLKT